MKKRRPIPPAPEPITVEELRRADPRAVARLAASERDAWKMLERMLGDERGQECPPRLLRALLDVDGSMTSWLARVGEAYAGLAPDDGGHGNAVGAFERWLSASVVRGLPPSDPVALDALYFAIRHHVDDDTVRRARELVAALEAGGDDRLLAPTLIVLARRLAEDGDVHAALAAAERAETLAQGPAWRGFAERVHAAQLLRLGKIDDALALLDRAMEAPRPLDAAETRMRPSRRPVDPVLEEAASTALVAAKDSERWITALGRLAKRFDHRGCAERHAEGQRLLDERRPREPDIWEEFERQGRIV